MSFVAAMDNHTPIQVGENGHTEFAWSKNPTEKLSQFYFQLVRTNSNDSLLDLYRQLDEMIIYFKKGVTPEHIEHLVDLYRLIGHTRDIVNGKGERTLTYVQIIAWFKHFPELAYAALRSLVYYIDENDAHDPSVHQYGSWNDIKYFCHTVTQFTEQNDVGLRYYRPLINPLINYAVGLIVDQLKADKKELESDKEHKTISLAAKHSPREGSKYDRVFKLIAYKMVSFKTDTKKAQKAARTHLRVAYYAPLNKFIDTVEVKMADSTGKWKDINFNRVPSKALGKYKKAWLNKNKKGEQRSDKEDRIVAAEHYHSHIAKAKEEASKPDEEKTVKVHGKRCEIYDLVKSAVIVSDSTTADQINLQWLDHGKSTGNLQNVIAMVDTSSSMSSDDYTPMYNAIGLGIRIAEKASPAFRDRVLTFNTVPVWYNLSDCPNFVSKVQSLQHSPWGGSTNIYSAFVLMLDVIRTHNITADEVANMTLVILSDMQINSVCNTDTLYDNIKMLYGAAGFDTPPHIVFWNLRKTTGFPVKSDMKNVTMLSGFSSVLLNQFCEKGVDVLKNYDSYTMIHDILRSPRYDQMERAIRNYFKPKPVPESESESEPVPAAPPASTKPATSSWWLW